MTYFFITHALLAVTALCDRVIFHYQGRIVVIHLIFANSILVLHLIFILFVVFGGLFTFYKKWMPWLHIHVLCWAVLIEFFGWICPLTPLGNHFRTIAGQSSYGQGFIQHYLLKVIYPDGLTRQVQILPGLGVWILNLFVYSFFLKKKGVVKKI